MIRRLKKWLGLDWVMVESSTAFWNLTHGESKGLRQDFCFFIIEYSPSENYYRLRTKGHNAKKHHRYGEMLTRVGSLNSGVNPIDGIEADIADKIMIIQFPLENDAEKVFEFIRKDEDLKTAINNVAIEMKKKGVEVFEIKSNIVATEEGYFGAFWEEEVQKGLGIEEPHSPDNDEPTE